MATRKAATQPPKAGAETKPETQPEEKGAQAATPEAETEDEELETEAEEEVPESEDSPPPAPPASRADDVPPVFSTKVSPKKTKAKSKVFAGKVKAKNDIRMIHPAAKDGFIPAGTVFECSEEEAAHLLKLDAVELE
jgi:hypothetical protein